MTPETETALPAAGSNGCDFSDVTITHAYIKTRESSEVNGGQ